MADVIFTPVFNGEKYKYHQCSECEHHIEMVQKPWGGIYFGGKEDVKFCPHCGNQVIRFSDKAIFETPIDFEPLYPFYKLHREYEDKCKWMYYCVISGEQQLKISDIIEFAKKESGWVRIAADAAQNAKLHSPSWQTLRKLERRFGREKEQDTDVH